MANSKLVTKTSTTSDMKIHHAWNESTSEGAHGSSPMVTIKHIQLELESVIDEAMKQYTLDEVAEHWEMKSCWVVLFDFVFDVTEFLREHPGGTEILLEHAGIDATLAFKGKGHSDMAYKILKKYCIGKLVMSERIY